MSDLLDRLGKLTQKQLMLLAFDQQRRLDEISRRRPDAIAVIGIGCRFPGGGNDPQSFWELLREGRDAIREVPADRWDIDGVFDPDPDAPARMSVRSGGFLDDVSGFDAAFFGISPREAITMDPQQRLLLEVTWEALEHANVAADRLAGSATGVFVGLCNTDHFQRLLRRGHDSIDAYLASGNAPSVAAGRIAYALGLRGPALTVDTSCSSSLVAIHLACQSLRSQETRLALAGGVNVMCSPETTIALSKAHMLAPDGRCKGFDAAADGFARGEGCGVLVLKRLNDAISDGDTILAVIRGTAVNQDGRSGGLTVPNGPAQEAVIRAALDEAGATPEEIDYVEAHGTGTSLGDPIEIRALAAALGGARPHDRPLLVGSVKSNVGHLEAAAGVAGVIKVILALENGAIPPHLHFRHPSPHIPWDECKVAVTATERPWPPGARSRMAGVSSFGFSGTNAHAVVQEPPRSERSGGAPEPRSFHCLPLSARTESALAKLAARYARTMSHDPKLGDVAHTAGIGRSHLTRRLAIVADTAATAISALNAFAAGGSHPALHTGTAVPGQPGEVVFVFAGQEAAYPGMAGQLYETSGIYRHAIDRCDELIGPDSFGRTLKSALGLSPGDRAPADAAIWARLSLFAAQYAAARLWTSFGVEPAAVIGDADGEYAAACVAGVFSLETCLRGLAGGGQFLRSADASPDAAEDWSGWPPANAPRIPVAWSGGGASMYEAPGEAYWRHRRPGPDGFMDAVGRLYEANYRSFLEVGPKPVLTEPMKLRAPGADVVHLTPVTPGQDDWNRISHALAAYYVQGGQVNWAEVSKGARKCRLPTYPFEHRSFWYSPSEIDDMAHAAAVRGNGPASLAARPDDRPPTGGAAVDDLFYQLLWQPAPLPNRAAASLTAPEHFAPMVRERFAALAESHGLSIYDRLLPELDRLSAAYLAMALRQLGFDTTIGRVVAVEEEAARLSIAPRHRRLFARLLDSLSDDGVVRRDGAALVISGPLTLADPEELSRAAIAAYGDVDGELRILQRCGRELARVLTGDQDPLELLFPGGSFSEARKLYVESPAARTYNTALAEALSAAIDKLPSGASLRVLEIGAGTGGTTSYVLPRLPAGRVDYVFTDVSPIFLERAVTQFGAYDFLRTALLDIEQDPIGQGFQPGQFDVVIAANALHATQDLRRTVGHVRSLLAPGGLLFLLEAARPQRWADFAFGLTEGWWRFSDHSLRPDYPLISHDAWHDLLTSSGFTVAVATQDDAHYPRSRSQQALVVARSSSGGHRWTLIGDVNGVGAALARRLEARGDSVVLVCADADTATALPGGSIVYLGALELADRAYDDPTAVESCKNLACTLPLRCLAEASAGSDRVWLVTRGAQPAPGGLSSGARWQAPLWGIGRTLALEQPGRLAGLVDLPPAGSHEEWADTLLATFDAGDGEDQTAWRDGARLVPRLSGAAPPVREPVRFRPDATYLITGGFGGIGLLVAHWMAEHGARYLALVGRHPNVAADAVHALAALGARVIPLAADVADEASMTAALSRLAAEAPPVRGVMHAAAEFGAFPIVSHRAADIAGTLRAKIDGTVVLERALRDCEIDFLVLFSSAAAVLGAANYAHYAAANAFLDATAEAARGPGKRVLAANWGAWEASADKNHDFREGGLVPMPPNEALAALGRLLFSNENRRVVGRFDWSVLRPLLEARHRRPLLADLGTAPKRSQPVQRAEASDTVAERLARAPADMRRAVLDEFVRAEVAGVLGLAANDPIDPETGFFDLGMDSLTSVELKRRLERGTGRSLPSSLTFSYPNLRAMSEFLACELGETAGETDRPDADSLPIPEETAFDDLTETELEARLLARLQEVR
nr:type I polyketide synthase [uncultured Rhodopila sp.]